MLAFLAIALSLSKKNERISLCRNKKWIVAVAYFRQNLSAVGVLKQDCRYIVGNFGAMSLVAKTPWKAPLKLKLFLFNIFVFHKMFQS